MKEYLPYVGDKRAAKAWDELLSREMLGAVVVGSAFGKVVEKAINLFADTTFELLIAWSLAVPVGVVVFVYWHRIESAAEAAKETVEDTTD